MRNIALEISYDGTRYSGLQVQKNAVTIQGVIEEMLEKILKNRTRIKYAGRTDAGVHALGQVVSFHTDSSMTESQFYYALNALLPGDIRVMRAFEVAPTFHPRYDAQKRWYRYIISTVKNQVPFFNYYALWLRRDIDCNLLGRYCRRITGRHDFTSFACLEGGENPSRIVFECSVKKKNDFIVFDIIANSFLRKMVRTIVGTFLELEKANEEPGTVDEILQERERAAAGKTVYAGGLYLAKIFY